MFSYDDSYSWFSESFIVIGDKIIFADPVGSKLFIIEHGNISKEIDDSRFGAGLISIIRSLPRLGEFMVSLKYRGLFDNLSEYGFYNTDLELIQTTKIWHSCRNTEVVEDGILCLNPPRNVQSWLINFDGRTVKKYDLAATAPKGKKAVYSHPFWFYRERGSSIFSSFGVRKNRITF